MNETDPAWHPDDERTVLRTAPAGGSSLDRGDWRHVIVVVQGPEPGRRHAVADKALTLGRRPGVDILIAEAEVSAQHCQIQAVSGRDTLVVTDLHSTNGTYLDGRRVKGHGLWVPGGLLQVGSHLFRHEFQPPRLADAALEVDRDLDRAGRYVMSLLPPPLSTDRLRADWVFKPSARLGGDGFGYLALDDHRFIGYLIDVCGHGAGAAMHTVSVLNVLRQRALPDTDMGQPAAVLARMNSMFRMDDHDGLYFTMWYGVYDARDRSLRHAAAGHHPAYLRGADGRLQALGTRNPMIGVLAQHDFAEGVVEVPVGACLYAFSDGVFETLDADGRPRGLGDFVPYLLEEPVPGLSEPERLHRRVTQAGANAVLDDDFSVVTVTFLS